MARAAFVTMVITVLVLNPGTGMTAADAASPPATLYDLLVATKDLSEVVKLFNYTGLLQLTKNPNTTITCFLPSNKNFNFTSSIVTGWESGTDQGRWAWAIMLHHCLDGPTARTLANFSTGASSIPSAFVWRPMQSLELIEANLGINKKSASSVTVEDEVGWNRGKVIKANLKGGKSVVHIIDSKALIPSFAPPDTFLTASYYMDAFSDVVGTFLTLFKAASTSVSAAVDKPTQPITVLVPEDLGVRKLLQQLNVTLTTLLSKKKVLDLLVRAHVINGRALYVGSMLQYGAPLQYKTMAGSFINATTDLSIFPNRAGPAKFVTLSTVYNKDVAYLGDYDISGNSNDNMDENEGYAPLSVYHTVSEVLLPVSLESLKKLLGV